MTTAEFATQVMGLLVEMDCDPGEISCGYCDWQSGDHAPDCLWDQAEKLSKPAAEAAPSPQPGPRLAWTQANEAVWRFDSERLRIAVVQYGSDFMLEWGFPDIRKGLSAKTFEEAKAEAEIWLHALVEAGLAALSVSAPSAGTGAKSGR
jgi:hypothetical protein